jgi:hypothetical protein
MRKKYSSNFVMNQVLKQRFNEIQNIFSINDKTEKREENNEVNIEKKVKILIKKYKINFLKEIHQFLQFFI